MNGRFNLHITFAIPGITACTVHIPLQADVVYQYLLAWYSKWCFTLSTTIYPYAKSNLACICLTCRFGETMSSCTLLTYLSMIALTSTRSANGVLYLPMPRFCVYWCWSAIYSSLPSAFLWYPPCHKYFTEKVWGVSRWRFVLTLRPTPAPR